MVFIIIIFVIVGLLLTRHWWQFFNGPIGGWGPPGARFKYFFDIFWAENVLGVIFTIIYFYALYYLLL